MTPFASHIEDIAVFIHYQDAVLGVLEEGAEHQLGLVQLLRARLNEMLEFVGVGFKLFFVLIEFILEAEHVFKIFLAQEPPHEGNSHS